MADSVFRSISQEPESSKETEILTNTNKSVSGDTTNVEVPYLDFESTHKKPFVAEYYKLGDNWQDGFNDEVSKISEYINDQIRNAEIANSQESVKSLIKKLEKQNQIDKEKRSVIKIGVLAAHIDFLNKTKNIKNLYKKYNYG